MRSAIRLITTLVVALGMMAGSIAGLSSVAAQDDKPDINVGAVGYTEQEIVGEMVSLILEDAGFNVERSFGLASEAVLHQAHLSGDVNLSVQYTGSGIHGILSMEVPEEPTDADGNEISIPEWSYNTVKAEFAEQFDMVWLEQLGFNNTYAFLVRSETAEEYGLETVSDLAEYTDELVLGTDVPFPARPDGLPGVEEAYGFEFDEVIPMDYGLLYQALDNGDVDISVGYSTDGRIPMLNLVILEDDRDYFPPYYAAPVVNQDVLDQAPEVADLLNQLGGLFDDETMAELNYQVDEENRPVPEVAQEFLEEHGILDGGDS